MDSVSFINRVKQILKCPICSAPNEPLVRIRTCGHYMCKSCLENEKDSLRCPRCTEKYNQEDVLPNSDADKCRRFLENIEAKQQTTGNKVNNNRKFFIYNNNTYNMVTYKNRMRLNTMGESALYSAIKKNQVNLVRQKLEEDCYDLNSKDNAGWTVLHEAVVRKSIVIVRMLLTNGALVNVPGFDNTTPLHMAVNQQNIELIKIFLEYGADVNMIDSDGRKPIDYTARADIKKLLAQPDIRPTHYKLWFCELITVYCHSILPEYKTKLEKCKRADVRNDFDVKKIRFSHIIIKKTHKLSLKILLAIVSGVMIAPQEWIDDFLQGNMLIPITDFEFCYDASLNGIIKKAMLNSVLKMPKLFEGISFYIVGHKKNVKVHDLLVDATSLSKIILAGGGNILKREPTPNSVGGLKKYPFHANTNGNFSYCSHYTIFEEEKPPDLQYKMDIIKHQSSKWLIDCILNFSVATG